MPEAIDAEPSRVQFSPGRAVRERMDLIDAIDEAVLDFVVSRRTELATSAGLVAMYLGSGSRLYMIGTLAAAYLVARGRWRLIFGLAVALIATVAATAILKPVIARPRPPQPFAIVAAPGYAMPSGTAASTAAAGVVLWSGMSHRSPRRRLISRATIAVVVVGTGIFMVYLGAHWVTDVVAGWSMGIVFGLVGTKSVRWPPNGGDATN